MPDREMVRGINMTTYARKVNGEFVKPYPYGMSHLKADFPGKSFPHLGLLDEGFRQKYDIVEVEDARMPTKPGFVAMLQFPIEKDGKWVQHWELVAKKKEDLVGGDIHFPEQDQSLLTDSHGNVVKQYISGETVWKNDRWEMEWILEELPYQQKRTNAYGFPIEQLEYITENGLEAWQAKVAEIKSIYPKV